jgi:hypothetical protein
MNSKNHIGAMGELFASQWFLGQGLEVFLNLPSCGPADLVVWNKESGCLLPVDIKTINRPYTRKDGTPGIGDKCRLREDGVWNYAYVLGEASVRVPEGFWEALGCPSASEVE